MLELVKKVFDLKIKWREIKIIHENGEMKENWVKFENPRMDFDYDTFAA